MSVSTQYRSNPVEKSPGSGDYFGSLPNGLIADILSRLPIKEAFRTSVLSKYWEFKWNLIFNVHIDANELFPKPSIDDDVFVKFVERLLSVLEHLRSFHLNLGTVATCCEGYEANRLIALVSNVLKGNLESLQLRMSCDPSLMCNHTDKALPHNLLNCDSLKDITVDMPCTFKVAVMNCFPKLTSLSLNGVTIKNGDSNIDSVTFDVPVLEDFNLKDCKWFGVKFVEIHAPSLANFRSNTSIRPVDDVGNHLIKIVGSKLENVMVSVHDQQNVILVGSRVACATLDLSPVVSSKEEYMVSAQEDGLKVRRQLGELSRVHSLRLFSVLEAIGLTKEGPPLPKFHLLENLDLYAPITVKGLLELLHSTPRLKSLFLHVQSYDNDEDYNEVEKVPPCVACHLETVMLDYSFCPDKPNLNEAKFLLKSSFLSLVICVCGCPSFPTDKIVKKLYSFPKAALWLRVIPAKTNLQLYSAFGFST